MALKADLSESDRAQAVVEKTISGGQAKAALDFADDWRLGVSAV